MTILWDIPVGTRAGRYRIRYSGDVEDASGALHPLTGISPAFEVGPSGPVLTAAMRHFIR